MAEERLVDDDKDRKYRIRINDDGEEELELADYAEEPEGSVPEYGFEEDERQSERELALREEAASRRALDLLRKAEALGEEGQTDYAIVTLDSARRQCERIGGIYPLEIKLLTGGFTGLSRLDEVAELTPKLKEHCSPAERREVFAALAPVCEREIAEQEGKNRELAEENEQKKAERRIRFKARLNRAAIAFACAAVPFVIFMCAGIGFATVMRSDLSGAYMAATIAMFVLAAAAFVLSAAFARPLAKYARRMRRNEDDNSTALGRSLIKGRERADKLRQIYSDIECSDE